MSVDVAKAREPGAALNQMVCIAPGEGPFKPTFTLGSDDDDQAFPDEKPSKVIAMLRAYAIGRYAVTQEEFNLFVKATGYSTTPFQRQQESDAASPRRWPAFEVNWRDAMAYCRWLEAVTGDAYRLPSEVEWEYACRAGATTRYSWGDEWDPAKAASVETQSGKDPTDVDSYNPNDWGLWQMHGNVFEWCGDPWHQTHHSRPAGQGIWDVDGDSSRRVVRGGSWSGGPQVLRSAYRDGDASDGRFNDLGVWLARTLGL
jgi:formylglycine-generating enzyme required for sulfatase activity